MADELKGVTEKLVRAGQHLDTLNCEIAAFLKDDAYSFYAELNLSHSEYLVVSAVFKPTPGRFGVILGDFVHNLRSALDHVVWQLVLRNKEGVAPPEGTWPQIQFPICRKPTAFAKASVRPFLSSDQITALEEVQPYKSGDDYLLSLKTLSNTDKHRVVNAAIVTLPERAPPFVANADAVITEVEWASGLRLVPLEHQAVIAYVRFAQVGPDPQVEMQTFPVEIAFGEATTVAASDLARIADAVSTAISRLDPLLA